MGAGASEGFLREVGVTTACWASQGTHRCVRKLLLQVGQKGRGHIRGGPPPHKDLEAHRPSPPALRPYSLASISPCLFLLSPGRWASGEPKAQRLALFWGSQVCLITSPIHLLPTTARTGTRFPQHPAAPKHLTPVLTLWATAAWAEVMQGPGEKGREHRGHESVGLSWVGNFCDPGTLS